MNPSFHALFDLSVYNARGHLFVSPDVRRSRRSQAWMLGALSPDHYPSPGDRWFGLFRSYGGDYAIFLDSGCLEPGFIAHEVTHLVFQLLSSRRVPLTVECDEAACYLHGYVTERIYELLADNNIQILCKKTSPTKTHRRKKPTRRRSKS